MKIKNIRLREKENQKELCADVEYKGKTYEIWYRTTEEDTKYLCYERADCYVVALLLFAMKNNENIEVEGTPISAKLYQNLNLSFIPSLSKTGEKYKKIKIIGNTINEPLENAGFNGAGMSCGIDSFTTLMEYTSDSCPESLRINCLTFFNMGSNGDLGGDEARKLFIHRKKRSKAFADEYGFKFVEIDSNLSEFLSMNFYETHTLRNSSAVLALQKMFKNYYYSSGIPISSFNINEHTPAAYDIFTLNMVSNDNVQIYSAGTPYNRVEKTKMVSNYEPSYKYLNVCTTDDTNCCTCEKCLRTILTLQAINKLDNYKDVFDLSLIEKNKEMNQEFFQAQIENNVPWYKEIKNIIPKDENNSKTKILLFVYTKLNLGDNLFVYTLAKKYPNIDFYIQSKDEEYKKAFDKYENIKIIEEDRLVDNVDIEKFDKFIYIGGSIFIESEYSFGELKEFNKFIKKCNTYNKPFFYMSCNFGPYKTEEYLGLAKENFKICEGTYFRDKKSYEIFKDMENVHYAPDYIFAMDYKKTKKEKKSIGISVIDVASRDNLKNKQNEYEDFIKRIIIKFAKRNYKVYLFSFCEFEQDELAIDKILKNIPQSYINNIKKVSYKNNIEEFLCEYSKMEYMVATRFHSMILSILFDQKIYNLIYSKKTSNVIEELELFKNYIDIKDLTFDTIMRKWEFKSVKKEKKEEIKKIIENTINFI